MKQMDIYLAELNPVKGQEQGGARPVVIISGDLMNTTHSVVMTCPISSKVKNFAGCVVLEPTEENGLSIRSEIITFQVRTVSKNRLIKKIGSIKKEEFRFLINGLYQVLKY